MYCGTGAHCMPSVVPLSPVLLTEPWRGLVPFSTTRLLGARVPYVVEAYPEYGMRHLSAESALYARVFTEGILGIEPLGTHKFKLTPNIPLDWDYIKINDVHILQSIIDIEVLRNNNQLEIKVFRNGFCSVNSRHETAKAILWNGNRLKVSRDRYLVTFGNY
jgi:hypothetical protein